MKTSLIRHIAYAIVSMVLGSCGSDRQFNNPDDPDNAKTTSATGELPTNTGTTNTDTSNTNTTNSNTSGGQCLTSACSQPTGSIYNFSNVFAVNAPGCSDFKQVRIFDTGSGLAIFFNANCGSRNSVYSILSNYSGGGQSTPALLSTDCNSGSVGVKSYTIDKGSSGYVMAYECNPSSNSYTTRIVAINSSGASTAVLTYESGTSSRSYILAWNSTASTFGLARAGQFQRYSEAAVAVGGPIATNTGTLYQNFVNGGNWYLVNSSYFALCSKVSTAGSLQCNGVSTGVRVSGGALASVPALVNAYSTGEFNTYTINTANCTATEDADLMDTTNTISASFGGKEINTNISSYLYKSTNSLLFTTFSSTQIYAENAVAGYSTSMGSAEAKFINSKVYVSYDKDGAGYVSYSAESVP